MSDIIPLSDLASALKEHAGRTLAYTTLYYHARSGRFETHMIGRNRVVRRLDLPAIATKLGLDRPEGERKKLATEGS